MLVTGFAAVKSPVVMATETFLNIRFFNSIPRFYVCLVGLMAECAVLNSLFRFILVGPVLVRVHGCYFRLLGIEFLEKRSFSGKFFIWAVTHQAFGFGCVRIRCLGISGAGRKKEAQRYQGDKNARMQILHYYNY